MPPLRLRPAPAFVKTLGSALALLLAFVLLFACVPPSVAQGDEPTRTARVLYHFMDPDQLGSDTPFTDRESELSAICVGEIWESDRRVVIQANAFPHLMETSADAASWRVLKDYASTSASGKGTQDITDQAVYDAETGTVSLPAEFADADLTVAWYVPADKQAIEIPLQISIAKTIEGVSSETTLEHVFAANTQTINVKLFDDEEQAARIQQLRITQGGAELTQYIYQNGSLCLTASPLGGPIFIEATDNTEAQASAPDTESAVNTDRPIFSLFSAANPVVGERFTLEADSALIRTCEPGGNMAQACGWSEKSGTYGFAVHFNKCVNPEVVNADQNHVAPGGTVHTPGGGTYDYNWIRGMHFAWGECAGNVDDNGTGEPKVTSGWVEVTNVDYNTQTVSYRYYLNVCSDVDGHAMQSIMGTFQVHEDLVGYIELKKASALEDISANNGCYSLEGARYGIYTDADCTDLKQTLTTDGQGCARSKALPVGTYYVKEIAASQGYALDITAHEVKVAAGTTRTCAVEEVPQSDPTPLLLAKHDSDYAYSGEHNPIQGGAESLKDAQFTITFHPTLDANYAAVAPLRTWVVKTDEHGFIDLRQGDGCKISGDEFFYDTTGQITLPIGTYAIRETKAPTGYTLSDTVAVRTVKGVANGEEAVSSYNTPIVSDRVIRGGIELEKRDAESGLQSALGAASLDNTTFTITNDNSHEVCVGGIFYQPGEVCATLIAQDGKAATARDALPFGDYILREVVAGNGYNVFAGDPRSFSIEHDGQVVSFSDPDPATPGGAFRNYVKRGDLNFVKVRESDEQRLAGVPFKITSRTTGEAHVVVSDANGIVNTSSNWTKHSTHTNENDQDPYEDECGVWFGKAKDGSSVPVRDDLGALPFDTYTLEELPCEANEGLELVTTTFSIYRDQQQLDFGVVQNHDPSIPWLVTKATDDIDHDKLMTAQGEVVINDHIQYGNLKEGQTYTLKGELVDKETGQIFDGVAGITTFTATGATGTTEVRIPVNLAEHPVQDIVVYETLSQDDEVLLEHNDIGNTEQTVSVIAPRIATSAVDAADGDHFVLNDQSSEIVDTVSFTNLVVGQEYSVSGTLMKKIIAEDGTVSGEALTGDSGEPIQTSITFTPQVSDGSADVSFTFDASVLEEGCELVVFETLSRDGSDVADHRDINDSHQTVTITKHEEPPAPNTPDEPEPETPVSYSDTPKMFAKTGAAIMPWIIGTFIIFGCAALVLIVALFKHRKAQEITAAIAYNMLGRPSRWS